MFGRPGSILGDIGVMIVCRGLGRHGVSFGHVNRSVGMIGRTIDRVQLELVVTDVHDVMPGAGRNDHRPVVGYGMFLSDLIG